jgi:hypothetical protein
MSAEIYQSITSSTDISTAQRHIPLLAVQTYRPSTWQSTVDTFFSCDSNSNTTLSLRDARRSICRTTPRMSEQNKPLLLPLSNVTLVRPLLRSSSVSKQSSDRSRVKFWMSECKKIKRRTKRDHERSRADVMRVTVIDKKCPQQQYMVWNIKVTYHTANTTIIATSIDTISTRYHVGNWTSMRLIYVVCCWESCERSGKSIRHRHG